MGSLSYLRLPLIAGLDWWDLDSKIFALVLDDGWDFLCKGRYTSSICLRTCCVSPAGFEGNRFHWT